MLHSTLQQSYKGGDVQNVHSHCFTTEKTQQSHCLNSFIYCLNLNIINIFTMLYKQINQRNKLKKQFLKNTLFFFPTDSFHILIGSKLYVPKTKHI